MADERETRETHPRDALERSERASRQERTENLFQYNITYLVSLAWFTIRSNTHVNQTVGKEEKGKRILHGNRWVCGMLKK